MSSMATCLSDRECALERTRRVLQTVGYQEAAVKTALDVKGELMMSSGHVSRYRRSLRGQGQLLDIIRLFILAEPLELLDAVRALAPVEMTSLEELGLVESKGDVRSSTRSPDAVSPCASGS